MIMLNVNLKQRLKNLNVLDKQVRDAMMFVTLASAMICLPFLFSNPLYYEITQTTFIYSILILGANLVFLKTRELALAQLALFGIGAYSVAIFEQYEWDYHGIVFIIGLVLVFFVGIFLLTLPLFFLKRHGFVSVLSLLLAFLMHEAIDDFSEWTGGSVGLTLDSLTILDHPIENEFVWYAFYALFLIIWMLLFGFMKHIRYQLCRKAWQKALVFSVCSASTILLGCFYAYNAGSITPAEVDFEKAFRLLAISFMVGFNSLFSVIIVSFILVFLLQFVKINPQYYSLFLLTLVIFGITLRYSFHRVKQHLIRK